MESTSIYLRSHTESSGLSGQCRYFGSLPTFQQPHPERWGYGRFTNTKGWSRQIPVEPAAQTHQSLTFSM